MYAVYLSTYVVQLDKPDGNLDHVESGQCECGTDKQHIFIHFLGHNLS